MGGNVVEELFCCFQCGFGAFVLSGGYGAECGSEGRVDRSAKKQESAHYSLNEFDLVW